MDPLLFFPFLISFYVTLLLLPKWISRARKAGLEGRDMNKYEKPKVAEAGGVIVVAGFVIGVLSYIALKTFYFKSSDNLVEIFALMSSIIIIAFVGFIDDLLGWKIGLEKSTRLLLVFIAAIPLMAINAGQPGINFPGFNGINLGLLYTLLLIPLGVVGASTTFNFLAGYNGLEAKQGILILTALSLIAYSTGNKWLALIGLCMVFSLICFWIFNRYPAKVFPGDVMTYSVGGLIAFMAILGDFEKIAVFFFIPYIAEVVLKLRGKLKKESFAAPQKDNSLEMPYEKIYGLEHFAIWFIKKFRKNKKVYEKDVVNFILIIQILILIIGFVLFKGELT